MQQQLLTDDFQATLQADILKALAEDKLRLPTQPEVAVRIKDTVEDPNATCNKLCEIISNDPALTAKLIKIANSPLMRGAVKIDTLNSAVSRLGAKFVGNIAISIAMEQIFHATNETIDKWINKVWENSSKVAAFCHVLAKHVGFFPADQAMIGGLLHEIGILPILTYVEENNILKLLDSEEEFYNLIIGTQPKLGQSILSSWKFPDQLINMPLEIYDFNRRTQSSSVIDLVQIAILQLYQFCGIKTCAVENLLNSSGNEIYYANIDCFKKFDLNPTESLLDQENFKESYELTLKCFAKS